MNANVVTTVLRGRNTAIMALAIAAMVSTSAHASLIVSSSSHEIGTIAGTSPLAGFTNGTDGVGDNAYNFVFSSAAAAASSPGATSEFNAGVWMHSVAGSSIPASPDGGAILALDSDYHAGPISTMLTGLTIGDIETVSFYFSDAQQSTYSGASEDAIAVSLGGGAAQSTGIVTDPDSGSTPWILESFSFGATSTSEALTFLASGGTNPAGGPNVPAFALIDNLTVSQTTPEPSSLMLLSTGLIGLGGLVRSRFKKTEAASL